MSNELQFSAALAVTNGNLTSGQSVSATADQTAPGAVSRELDILTSVTVIDLSGVATPRAIILETLEPAGGNYVDIGVYSGSLIMFARLYPNGEPLFIPLYPGAVLKGQAHTATVPVAYTIVNA